MVTTKFNPIQFESELELLELLRDKSKDFRFKENEELKKKLTTCRKQNIIKTFVTPNFNK